MLNIVGGAGAPAHPLLAQVRRHAEEEQLELLSRFERTQREALSLAEVMTQRVEGLSREAQIGELSDRAIQEEMLRCLQEVRSSMEARPLEKEAAPSVVIHCMCPLIEIRHLLRNINSYTIRSRLMPSQNLIKEWLVQVEKALDTLLNNAFVKESSLSLKEGLTPYQHLALVNGAYFYPLYEKYRELREKCESYDRSKLCLERINLGVISQSVFTDLVMACFKHLKKEVHMASEETCKALLQDLKKRGIYELAPSMRERFYKTDICMGLKKLRDKAQAIPYFTPVCSKNPDIFCYGILNVEGLGYPNLLQNLNGGATFMVGAAKKEIFSITSYYRFFESEEQKVRAWDGEKKAFGDLPFFYMEAPIESLVDLEYRMKKIEMSSFTSMEWIPEGLEGYYFVRKCKKKCIEKLFSLRVAMKEKLSPELIAIEQQLNILKKVGTAMAYDTSMIPPELFKLNPYEDILPPELAEIEV